MSDGSTESVCDGFIDADSILRETECLLENAGGSVKETQEPNLGLHIGETVDFFGLVIESKRTIVDNGSRAEDRASFILLEADTILVLLKVFRMCKSFGTSTTKKKLFRLKPDPFRADEVEAYFLYMALRTLGSCGIPLFGHSRKPLARRPDWH